MPENGAVAKGPHRASGAARDDAPFRRVIPVHIDQIHRDRGTRSLAASIGSVGDAYVKAAAETVMGPYKNKAVAKGSPFWSGPLKTIADLEEITFDWVDWYNNERLHGYLGTIPPEEYEQNYYDPNIGPSTGEAANKTAA